MERPERDLEGGGMRGEGCWQQHRLLAPLPKHTVIHWRLLAFSVGRTYDTIRLVESTG